MPKAKQVYDNDGEKALMTDLWSPDIADDLEAFVMYAFPWGKKGTPLEHQAGPRKWQMKILREVSTHIRAQRHQMAMKVMATMFRKAVASGRGIGKSALVAWLVLWMLSTRLGSTVVVTANTEAQLTSRTWAELGKWHAMAINAHWFDKAAMSLRPAEWFAALLTDQLKIDVGYYYAQAQLWSEEKPDAFAGVHNHNGILVIYDEASGIPQPIWNVTQGFFTEPVLDRYWYAFSNPRNNTGAFFECFHRFREFWSREQIDSRTVEGVDTAYLQNIVDQHGADSDTARVEVLGQFPNQGARQLIPMDHILGARERELVLDPGAPLVMGVDVARYGEDSSVIAFRQGNDARSIPWQVYHGVSTMVFADHVAEAIGKYNPDGVFIDANGVGGGVADRLKQLGYRVIEVNVQGAPQDKDRYINKRAEIWDRLKDWLMLGCIRDDSALADDLKGPEFKYAARNGALQLESKEDVKGRGLASPDRADALSMTFASPVARKDIRGAQRRHARVARDIDYDILGTSNSRFG